MSNLFNLTPETMFELQKELFKWQVYNFGEQDDRRMVLGICEEAGELCHAHLKLEQGIRGTKEELVAKMRDAIGDISVYALNLLSNHEEQLPGIGSRDDIEETTNMERIGDSVLGIFGAAAKIETARKTAKTNPPAPHPVAPHEVPAIARHVQQLFMHLNMLCGLAGWNLEEIIRETWSTVGKRNWKTHPEDGGASEQEEVAAEPEVAPAPTPAPRRRRRRRKAAAAAAAAAAPEPTPVIAAISDDGSDEGDKGDAGVDDEEGDDEDFEDEYEDEDDGYDDETDENEGDETDDDGSDSPDEE